MTTGTAYLEAPVVTQHLKQLRVCAGRFSVHTCNKQPEQRRALRACSAMVRAPQASKRAPRLTARLQLCRRLATADSPPPPPLSLSDCCFTLTVVGAHDPQRVPFTNWRFVAWHVPEVYKDLLDGNGEVNGEVISSVCVWRTSSLGHTLRCSRRCSVG